MSIPVTPVRNQQGIALLSVLLALTLMTFLVTELTFSFRTRLQTVTGRQQLDQARWYALSTEDLARKVLKQSFKEEPEVTHLNQYWAINSEPFPVPQGEIHGHIIDRQACFNLNALAGIPDGNQPLPAIKAFEQLLEYLEIEDSYYIAHSTRNWVSEQSTGLPGAQDSDYQALPVPYLAGHTLMRDASELRAVMGVTAPVANRVMPYLCALPTDKLKINVNTVSVKQPELLAALFGNNLPVDQALSILKDRNGIDENRRKKKVWESVDDFLKEPLLANFNTSDAKDLLTVNSSYFEVQATARYNSAEVRMESLMLRNEDNELSVIRRTFGGVE